MKITKSQLKELIRGQVAATLEETWKDVGGEYFPPHSEEAYAPEETKEEDYYGDSLHRGYDEDIDAIEQAFRNLAFSVIDEYKSHKAFDKNAASREILDTLQAAVDNFVEGGGGPNIIDLPKILADEFKEEEDDVEWMEDRFRQDQEDWPEDEPTPREKLKEAGDLTQNPDIRAWINSTQGQEQIRALMTLKSELMAAGLVTDDNHWEALLQDPVEHARVTRLWDQLGRVKTTGSRVAVEQIAKEELEKVLKEVELEEKKKKSKGKRTAKGNITQTTREKHATVGKDKFPIFDKKSAEAAIDLRGHASAADQKKIINKAAKYAPAAAKKAREVEKNK